MGETVVLNLNFISHNIWAAVHINQLLRRASPEPIKTGFNENIVEKEKLSLKTATPIYINQVLTTSQTRNHNIRIWRNNRFRVKNFYLSKIYAQLRHPSFYDESDAKP